ncbi:MAG: penicillin-insensitive murein endopeptidase [Leptospirales bacterium]|nr:penicillin-insensitive murein endopeptidase [Leptospirales bacterium]
MNRQPHTADRATSPFRRASILLLAIVIVSGCLFLQRQGVFDFTGDEPSLSIGSSVSGSLKNGKSLPCYGNNFRSYHSLGCLLRRNSVHSAILEIILETYAEIERVRPELRYVYGETGWPRGGRFRPHKSHQNGLCVDFFVPVRSSTGVTDLDTSLLTKFGYGIEFDSLGKLKENEIDWESMILHIHTLQSVANRRGVTIKFAIFDNELQKSLARLPRGAQLLGSVRFSRLASWVRHDEHYHIEFELPENKSAVP